ncbi:DUF1284 domain-containing protein [Ahrensia marina]|uniref:2Fe-2S ferredoxin n=1 Tax=Ahrensia marina TaxID=1514904 RepID=A0A0N0VM06_9HYPH|nr:DUF1284 domain-containing protein [Ahrensia marina]KPB01358.1 2Fe-2S ferredoxin [Ahrensia marina]
MTVRLRPHHLLCLLTYVGKGYSAEFIANYDRIAARLSDGEDIEIVAGPDDICAPLLDDAEAHCWRDSITIRDKAAAAALTEKLQTSIDAGLRLSLSQSTLNKMRKSFAAGSIRQACTRCEWHDLCTDVAASGYDNAKVSK